MDVPTLSGKCRAQPCLGEASRTKRPAGEGRLAEPVSPAKLLCRPTDSANQDPQPLFDASRLPDLALETAFGWLNLGDLQNCRQVCRRWRHMACRVPVIARTLVHSWTPIHRQQVRQALTACRASAFRPENGSEGLTPLALQHLLQQLLRTTSFSTAWHSLFSLTTSTIEHWSVSPDGQWIAVSWRDRSWLPAAVTLWHSLNRSTVVIKDSQLDEAMQIWLQFSADSRRLHVVDNDGQVHLWQLEAAVGLCRSLGHGLLEPGTVQDALFSPDGQTLAVAQYRELALYDTAGPDDPRWTRQWRRPWTAGESTGRLAMRFSRDSQHCVLALGNSALVCDRKGTDWRTSVLDFHVPGALWSQVGKAYSAPVPAPAAAGCVYPVFSDQSDSLALAFIPRGGGLRGAPAMIACWQWNAVQGWSAVRERGCDTRAAWLVTASDWERDRLPVVFSPDGDLLAMPAGNDAESLRLLQTRGSGAWQAWTLLPWLQLGRLYSAKSFVRSPTFSSTGQYLAVKTLLVLSVWQRQSLLEWIPVLRLSHPAQSGPAMEMAWSPDGIHCAVAMSDQGHLSLWGPDERGIWGCKLRSVQYARVGRLMFTPDATRLLVDACEELPASAGRLRSTACHLSCWHLVPESVPVPPGCR